MANEMSNENIIYGGPVGIDVTKDVKSLGEYILRELSVLGDKVAIVSNFPCVILRPFIIHRCYSTDRWNYGPPDNMSRDKGGQLENGRVLSTFGHPGGRRDWHNERELLGVSSDCVWGVLLGCRNHDLQSDLQ